MEKTNKIVTLCVLQKFDLFFKSFSQEDIYLILSAITMSNISQVSISNKSHTLVVLT